MKKLFLYALLSCTALSSINTVQAMDMDKKIAMATGAIALTGPALFAAYKFCNRPVHYLDRPLLRNVKNAVSKVEETLKATRWNEVAKIGGAAVCGLSTALFSWVSANFVEDSIRQARYGYHSTARNEAKGALVFGSIAAVCGFATCAALNSVYSNYMHYKNSNNSQQ